MKNKEFIVIENNYEMIFEDKKLAMDYYLDLCDWCEGAERDRYFETYSNIKHSKCNILTDGSKIKESRKYTYKIFQEEKDTEQKIIDEIGYGG